MKPRRVEILLELETNLPSKVLHSSGVWQDIINRILLQNDIADVREVRVGPIKSKVRSAHVQGNSL